MNFGLLLFYGILSLFPMSNSTNSQKMGLNYFEYNRGFSTPTLVDLHINYPGHFDLYFNDVVMYDYSFFPDDSPFPNAFFEPLFQGDIINAVKAFTEPYYGIRYYHFYKDNPQFGWGIEFIHFKVFLPSYSQNQQIVYITGTIEGVEVEMWDEIHNYIQYMSISHGVNHLSFSMVYRLMLFKTDVIPQGIVQPYISASFGPCIPHPELQLTGESGTSAYSYEIGFPNFGGGFNLGTRIQWSKHSGLYLEYKFTVTLLFGMYFDNGTDGQIDAFFIDNHFVWGFFLCF